MADLIKHKARITYGLIKTYTQTPEYTIIVLETKDGTYTHRIPMEMRIPTIYSTNKQVFGIIEDLKLKRVIHIFSAFVDKEWAKILNTEIDWLLDRDD